MTPKAQQGPKFKTTCKVCKQVFQASAIDPKDLSVVTKFATLLAGHLNQHEQLGAAVTTLLVGSLFETEDMILKASLPAMMRAVEPMRALLHQVTRRTDIPDSVIDGKIADLGFEAEDAEGLRLLLRDMRDLLTEQGAYAPPSQPAPSPLITP